LKIRILIAAMALFFALGSIFYVLNLVLKQQKLIQLKSNFFNNMTHELKTPISVISMASEILIKDETHQSEEKTKRYAKVIFEENAKLSKHVEQILEDIRHTERNKEINFETINIHKILEELIESKNILIKERQGKILSNLAAENCIINADKRHIINTFSNIIDNAEKYTQNKPIIKIGTYNQDNSIVISFIDNGIGISEKNISQIFKQYYRVPTGNIHNVKGFGIGLSYVKSIVDSHGGRIHVESVLGKGSRFEIHLPI
jgi:two-component system phosphate regulon sensor histidine kinase PhoR